MGPVSCQACSEARAVYHSLITFVVEIWCLDSFTDYAEQMGLSLQEVIESYAQLMKKPVLPLEDDKIQTRLALYLWLRHSAKGPVT